MQSNTAIRSNSGNIEILEEVPAARKSVLRRERRRIRRSAVSEIEEALEIEEAAPVTAWADDQVGVAS